jgi:hypothetical protein
MPSERQHRLYAKHAKRLAFAEQLQSQTTTRRTASITTIEKDKLTMSWKSEVIVNNEAGGNWRSNRLRFATTSEAHNYVRDLAGRWSMVTETRVVETDDPVTYRYIGGELLAVVQLLVHHDVEIEPDIGEVA